jgi:hypothetical protein
LWLIKVWFFASTFVVKIATFAKRQIVMPHSKKTTVQQTNDRKMKDRKANTSAKSKEMQPNAQAHPQLHHICFCPYTQITSNYGI